MKSDIHKMGTKSDLRTRIRHARVDSSDGQKFLEKARSYVFKGFNVTDSPQFQEW